MENQFIELNKVDMFSFKELTLFKVSIRKTSITRFELYSLIDHKEYTIRSEMRELFDKQIIEDMRDPISIKDKQTDNPFLYKAIICIHVGEKYFFVYENYGKLAKSLGGVDVLDHLG